MPESGPVLPAWMPPRTRCHPGCPWLDLAVGLVGLGYAPLPLNRQKRPLVKWAAFEVERPTWRVLYNDWWPAWQRAEGVGVITGPHSIVVADFDDDASWTWALERLPAMRGVRTRRGGHLHFRFPSWPVVIGNRHAVELAPGVRADVKGLGAYAVAPYSQHPTGFVYQPLGNWTEPVSELPALPGVIRRVAEDRPPKPAPSPPPPPLRTSSGPARVLEAYLAKVGRVPAEGAGSDEAVFRAAVWCKSNVPDLGEAHFVAAIRHERPEFDEEWIRAKWRSARGGNAPCPRGGAA